MTSHPIGYHEQAKRPQLLIVNTASFYSHEAVLVGGVFTYNATIPARTNIQLEGRLPLPFERNLLRCFCLPWRGWDYLQVAAGIRPRLCRQFLCCHFVCLLPIHFKALSLTPALPPVLHHGCACAQEQSPGDQPGQR